MQLYACSAQTPTGVGTQESTLVVYVGYHCHVVQTDQDVVASQIWQEGFECQKNYHLL